MNKTELVELFELLVEKGYHAQIEFHWFKPEGELKIHSFEGHLSTLKTIIGCSEITKTTWEDKSGMYAKATLDGNVDVMIFPKDCAFEGCRIVDEVVEVPDTFVPEHVVPAHKVVRKVVQCGKQKEE